MMDESWHRCGYRCSRNAHRCGQRFMSACTVPCAQSRHRLGREQMHALSWFVLRRRLVDLSCNANKQTVPVLRVVPLTHLRPYDFWLCRYTSGMGRHGTKSPSGRYHGCLWRLSTNCCKSLDAIICAVTAELQECTDTEVSEVLNRRQSRCMTHPTKGSTRARTPAIIPIASVWHPG
jgi:hypothetical protein